MTLPTFTQAHVLEEARRQYESGVADFCIDPRRLALVVVDMLDEFVKPSAATSARPTIRSSMRRN